MKALTITIRLFRMLLTLMSGAYLNAAAGAARQMRSTAGAPTNGTDEVQTLTISGTVTGGTFKLRFKGRETAAITWSATNATLLAAIDAALEALPHIGTGGVTVAAGTLTNGIGTFTVTFTGPVGKLAVPNLAVADNSLTGTSALIAFTTETTPGVSASFRGAPKGAQLMDTTNGIAYVNTGTATAPTWTKVGTQT